jgi:serine/threonine protein kinase
MVQPMTAGDALALHGHQLTEWERAEISEYPEVYYVGAMADKIDASRGAPRNGGYDDASGRYHYRYLDHVAYRYKLCEPLGKGAFGDCLRAYDYKRGMWVALKIIKNEPRYHRQGKVEVKVLNLLLENDRDNAHSLVHVVDSLMFRDHLVITFELLGQNLYTALRAGQFAGFTADSCRDVAGDLLRCLALLSDLQVVHADLKPENILLRPTATPGAGAAVQPAPIGANGRRSVAKVIDFGSSCFKHGRVHTYIQSRYYRAPEIVLGMGYGPSADMWSLGCILAELDGGYPLFQAKNEADLLLMQMEVLGCPPEDVQARCRRQQEFFDAVGRPLKLTDRKGRTRVPSSRPLGEAIKSTDSLFHDFVAKCLTWDPADRMTPHQAAEHPWMRAGTHALSKAAQMLGVAAETLAGPVSG